MVAKLDIPLLITMVGPGGARAALLKSEKLTMSDLRELVIASGHPIQSKKPTRDELVRILIAASGKRIDKTLDELRGLSEEQLRVYFEKTECSLEELTAFLDRSKLPYRRGLSRSELIRAAARQVSSVGVFQRIAGTEAPSVTSTNVSLSKETDKRASKEFTSQERVRESNRRSDAANTERVNNKENVNYTNASEASESASAQEGAQPDRSTEKEKVSESESAIDTTTRSGEQLSLTPHEDRHRSRHSR